MEHKKALDVLVNLAKKDLLNEEEKEAVLTAVGLLDCAVLADSQIKNRIRIQEEKRERSGKWE